MAASRVAGEEHTGERHDRGSIGSPIVFNTINPDPGNGIHAVLSDAATSTFGADHNGRL